MPGPDREELLAGQTVVTGIDFVFVHQSQTTLDIHFKVDPATLDAPLVGSLSPEQVRIYGASAPPALREIPVNTVSWESIDGKNVLRLEVSQPGDFSLYVLSIDDARVDPFFNHLEFSFKAGCPSDLDCAPRKPTCPPREEVDAAIDYGARDFWSFRRALLDFATLRYPDWKDRLEADAGVMLAEVMSALGDELAYYQDRVGREAYLETASQRRSLRRHARLVDYHVHDGLGASTWLDVTVHEGAPGPVGVLPAGADVWALSDDGSRVDYEIGRGLEDTLAGATFVVDAARNSLTPHVFDDTEVCLPFGATELHVKGHHAANLPLDDTPAGRAPGRWVLLRTDPPDASQPVRLWMIRLIEVEELTDPLVSDPQTGQAITRLVWEEAQATPFELDLEFLTVRGNMLPATAGKTRTIQVSIGPSPDPQTIAEAVERTGPNGTTSYLVTLPDPDARSLVWRAYLPFEFLVAHSGDPRVARPEIQVRELEPSEPGRVWQWRRSLLGVQSSQGQDPHYTLDDGTWTRVVTYRRAGYEHSHVDYKSGEGTTVRFGDGEFGSVPPVGTIFDVDYRLGAGRPGNVAGGSLNHIDPAFDFVAAVTNPLAAIDGRDRETAEEVRLLAPEAWRAVTYRAVRPADYAEAAERLEWVQRAGARLRWTGSWLTLFATPDPKDVVELAPDRRAELAVHLDRFRQTGREVHISDPRYADIDLEIKVCVEPASFRGDVEARVFDALFGVEGPRPTTGYFDPDRFTFGTPLLRSGLEAAIQAVPGVRAVEGMKIRRRGRFDWRDFDEFVHHLGDDEVLRMSNDPSHPEHGTVSLELEGGA